MTRPPHFLNIYAIHNLFIKFSQNKHTFNTFFLYNKDIKDKKGSREGSMVKFMKAMYEVWKVNGAAGTKLNVYTGTRKAEALRAADQCRGYAGRKQRYIAVRLICDNGVWELNSKGLKVRKIAEV